MTDTKYTGELQAHGDVYTTDTTSRDEIVAAIIDALSDEGIAAKEWSKGGNDRLYMTRGTGRKAQDMGYLALDEAGKVSGNYASRNGAGIRKVLESIDAIAE